MRRTVRLTENDLIRIVKRVINEQPTPASTINQLKPIEDIGRIKVESPLRGRDFAALGGLKQLHDNVMHFKDSNGRIWVLSKEWVWQQKGVDDQVRFVAPNGDGVPSQEFSTLFNSRKPF